MILYNKIYISVSRSVCLRKKKYRQILIINLLRLGNGLQDRKYHSKVTTLIMTAIKIYAYHKMLTAGVRGDGVSLV